MCVCSCCGDRDCCAPIIPQTDKAKNWRVGLLVVAVLHLVLLCVKVFFMGLSSGFSDLLALIILIVAVTRFDYCFIMFYIVLNLFEIFALIVVLGYYLQTDMGKNVPKHEEEPDDNPNAVEPDHKGISTGSAHEKTAGVFSQLRQILHHQGGPAKHSNSVHVVFKNLFNEVLKMKYNFYQEQQKVADEVQKVFAQQASAGSALMQGTPEAIGQSSDYNKGPQDSKKGTKLTDLHGPVFIITFCSLIILFYLVASLVAHCAYREYKGLAEDCAGGSINYKDGNILYYAIIDKREDDAIEERVERLKRESERNPVRQNDPDGDDDFQPLVGSNANQDDANANQDDVV